MTTTSDLAANIAANPSVEDLRRQEAATTTQHPTELAETLDAIRARCKEIARG